MVAIVETLLLRRHSHFNNMIKKLLPILLLSSTYLIGQAYTLFDNKELHNWFLCVDRPMTDAWNVKYLSEEMNRVVEALFMIWIFERSYVNILYRLAAVEYMLYRCIDLVVYPFWFKSQNYWYVFLALGLLMGFVYVKKYNYDKN